MDQLYRLSNNFLLEYNYTKDYKSLVNSPVFILKNQYNNSNYFFNDDTQKNITGNVRDNSAILVENGEFVSLNIDSSPYNDFDDKLTPTSQLTPSISNPGLNYDKVRIHVISGYNFEDSDGFILEIKIRDPFNKEHFLASYLFDKVSSSLELNPNPILSDQRIYNRFVDLEVPSLKSIIESFSSNFSDPEEIGNILTDSKGLTYQQNLIVNFLTIRKSENKGIYRFYKTIPENNFTIPLEQSLGNLSASIVESTNGDFYELSARYEDQSIENLILRLNSGSDADWIVLHAVDIIEQIVDTGFVMTQSYNFTQTENFEQPIFFRPVILNAEWAVSWTIDYTVSLFNQITGETISKTSKRTFLDPKKWGKSLRKINLGSTPIIQEIYNKIDKPVYEVKVTETRPLNSVKTVLSFVDSYNISVESKTEFSSDNLDGVKWGQRELNLPLTSTDNFYKFKIFRKTAENEFSFVNLNSAGNVIFRIIISNDEIIDIPSLEQSSLEKGEVVFKIAQITAQKANSARASQFFILLKNGDSESVIYEGKILDSFDLTQKTITNLNLSLKEKISENNNKIFELSNELAQKNLLIKNKEEDVVYLKSINSLYQKKIELMSNSLDTTEIDKTIQNKLREQLDNQQISQDLSAGNLNSNTNPNKIKNLNNSVGTYRNI